MEKNDIEDTLQRSTLKTTKPCVNTNSIKIHGSFLNNLNLVLKNAYLCIKKERNIKAGIILSAVGHMEKFKLS